MANGTLKVSNIQTSSGSGTITLGQSGETVDMSNGTITLNNTMKATPAFEAYLSSNQDTSNTTYDKIDCDTEVFDTDGCYDNSTNYRFTPTTAGKYFVYAGAVLESSIQSRLTYTQILIYKNGSVYKNGTFDMNDSYQENKTVITLNAAIDMNGSSDYLEFYVYMEASSATPRLQGSSNKPTYFGAYKIIGA
jgi:hypothetical protein